MNKLKVMVKNEFESDRTLAGKIAKLIGYSNPTPLYKFLNEEEREIDFQQVLTIVQELFPDREFDIMSEYIRTLKPTQRCAREALEYLTLNKINDLFVEMLEKLSSCANKESQEWAETYSVHWDVLNGNLKRIDAIEVINGMTFKSDEMKVFSKIIQFYYYNDLKMIDVMDQMSYLIENNMKKVRDCFAKNNYESRYLTVISSIYLHTNEISLLRQRMVDVVEKITNHNLLNIMYVIIGNSYLMESYDEALNCYNKALFHSNFVGNVGRTNQAKKSLNLLNSYWNKKKEFIQIDDDDKDSILADYAFNKCNFSKEEGLELLKKVDTSSFTDHGMGYYFFYLGIATEEEKYFFKSIKFFSKTGEKFFKRFPLIELEKMGVDEEIIDAFSV